MSLVHQRLFQETEWRLGILPQPLGLVQKAQGLTAHVAVLACHMPRPVTRLNGGILRAQGVGRVRRVASGILEAPDVA